MKSVYTYLTERRFKGTKRFDSDELLSAVVLDKIDKVKELLEAGANPDYKNKDTWTPLSKALLYGRTNIVELLLNQGADVNLVAGDYNTTPIGLVIGFTNYEDTMPLLASHGADINIADKQGVYPIMTVAKELTHNSDTVIFDLFKNAKKDSIIKALDIATQKNNKEFINFFKGLV